MAQVRPGPKSQTIVISGTDAARKLVVDLTPANGNAAHWEVSGGTGAQLPVVGTNANVDHYVFTRINATTLEAQYFRAGKPTIKQTAVVSADGKTLTVRVPARTRRDEPSTTSRSTTSND